MAVSVRSLVTRRPETAYHRVLVPLVGGEDSEQAISIAAQLAAEHGSEITAVNVIELPIALPMNAHMLSEEAEARRVLQEATEIGGRYGVKVATRVGRAREAGEAIVDEAAKARAEIIVLRAPRKHRGSRNRTVFGQTVGYVLRHAPCRVMVAAQPVGS